MSVLDQIRALETQVQQRLRELRPLVAEYRDLEKVAERLGLRRDDEAAEATTAKPAARAAAKPKPSAGRARKPAAKRRATKRKPSARVSKRAATAKAKPTPKRVASSTPQSAAGAGAKTTARKRRAAAPGEREQDVLRLVRERPGITVAEMADELDVDATGLYGVVRRLQGKGQITKDGTRLRAADAQPAASDGSAGPSAPSAPEGSTVPEASTQEDAEPPARES